MPHPEKLGDGQYKKNVKRQYFFLPSALEPGVKARCPLADKDVGIASWCRQDKGSMSR